MEEKRQQLEGGCNKYYRVLPVTTISMIFPVIYLLRFIVTNTLFVGILHAMLLLVAFLFVLDFKVKKLQFNFKKQ